MVKPVVSECGCGGGSSFERYPAPTEGNYPSAQPLPPISFVPVPQPLPVRIPQPAPKPSVTIPNIVLAILPPNQKPILPRPVYRPPPPPPVVVPLPRPYPLPVPAGCNSGCGF